MHKSQFLILWLLTLIAIPALSQPNRHSYSLPLLLDSAISRFPVSAQIDELNQIGQLTDQQLSTAYLPVLQINGQMSYQSEVTQLQIPVPGFSPPELAKDWYKLNLDVSQLIYDGGQVNTQKKIEATQNKIKLTEVSQQENIFKENIIRLYYRSMLLKQQLLVFASMEKSLTATAAETKNAVDIGAILESAYQNIQAEILRVQQQQLETEAALAASLSFLSAYTGLDLNMEDSLKPPVFELQETQLINLRPEWQSLKLQEEKTALLSTLAKSKRRPLLQAFGQAGYGRPGYNMLDDQFSDYYMAGLRLQFKLWDWHTSKREQSIARLNGRIFQKNIQNFEMNQSAAYQAKLQEISRLRKTTLLDAEVVKLQQQIVNSQHSGLSQGMITMAAFLQESEKLTRSMLGYETNKIRLLNAQTELMFITGKINFHEQ